MSRSSSFERMHDIRRLDLRLDLTPERDELRDVGRLDLEPHGLSCNKRIERAAERDVGASPSAGRLDLQALLEHERRHVGKTPFRTPSLTVATAGRRPDGTSRVSVVSGSVPAIIPVSIAAVASAIVPCPQAVE